MRGAPEVAPEVRQTLAPTGTLRIAVHAGSPTSMVRTAGSDEMRGVSVDLGRELDAFATNKAVLFERVDNVSGARILDGRWGLEQLAIAVPRGRAAAAGGLRGFADAVREQGWIKAAGARAGLRATVD